MRRRQLEELWQRLPELRPMKPLKGGRLADETRCRTAAVARFFRLVTLRIAKKDEAINEQTFTWRLPIARLR